MRIGVISDIHSNILAFRAATEYLEGQNCEEYLLLGDYVSDTPCTRETMDFLYDFINNHTCHLLRGNREEYMLKQRKAIEEQDRKQIWLQNSASGNLLFTYEQLTEQDLDFFDSLPICFCYEKEGYPAITCCHGSPGNVGELVQLYEEKAKEWLLKINTDYMICAHTHFPGELSFQGKHYFNAGCVGISIHDSGFAQCMILESEVQEGKVCWIPRFLKVPYDNRQVVKDIFATGMINAAPWFMNSNIQTLLTGEDHAAEMVNLAKQLAKQAGSGEEWPLMSDIWFERAAEQLGIPDYRVGWKGRG